MSKIFLFILVLIVGYSSKASVLEVRPSDNVVGRADAKITIIEYSSFSCPGCRSFHDKIYPELEEKYIKTAKVRFIFRDFPLRAMDLKASILAHCAPKERYFNFLEVLFKTQNNWAYETSKNLETLKNIGRLGGLSSDQMEKCFASKNLEDEIVESRQNAQKELAISSTPTFLINGEKLEGVPAKEKFFAIVDAAILKASV